MASVHKHIRSGTANKRPTTAIAEGQIALATNIASPGLFFKDSTGATIVKIGPVHVGATAPNVSPAGSAGNSIGEIWLDTSLTPIGVKIYNGSAFVNATPIGSTTVQGLLELATDAETQAGADTARAVTSASLQSKLSDSTSTTSSTTIASSTAVKAAYDLANAALPKTGGTVTGNLEIGTAGSLTFEGATADGFETTIAVVDPTADRTITLPNTTGTIVTTGDTGTVTSTMLLDGTIVDADINAVAAIAYSKLATLTSANIVLGSSANVATSTAVTGDVTISNTGVTAIASDVIVNADINASAAIIDTKLATIATAGKVSNSATTAASANTASAIVARDGSGNFTAGTITAALTGAASSNVLKAGDTMTGALVVPLASAATPSLTFTGDLNTGVFSPGADQVAVATNGTGQLFISSLGNIGIGAASPSAWSYGGNITIIGTGRYIASTNDDVRFASNVYSSDVDRYVTNGFATRYRMSDGTHQWTTAVTGVAGNAITYNESMRITAGGLVGIGTSSPGGKLDVRDAGTTIPALGAVGTGLNVRRTDGAIGLIIGYENTIGGSYIQAQHTNGSAAAYPLYLQPNGGNVGIGTTLCGAPLSFADTNEAKIQFNADSANFFRIGKFSGELRFTAGETSPGAFTFSSGGSEKARIDDSGRLLVGTSTARSNVYQSALNITPQNQIESNKGDYSGGLGLINNSTSGYSPVLTFGQSYSASIGGNGLTPNGEPLGIINFTGNDGNNFRTGALIIANVDGTSGVGDMPGRLSFHTTPDGSAAPTERMRINSEGQFKTLTTSTNGHSLVTTQGASGSINLFLGIRSATNVNDGTAVYVVYSNGTYATLSDETQKKNIESARSGYLEDLKQLRVVKYNWKDQDDLEPKELGLIAQEVEQVFPGLVSEIQAESGDVNKGVKAGVLPYMLLKALQEATSRIESLEVNNADLLARVTALEAN